MNKGTELTQTFNWVFFLSNGVFLLLFAMSVYFYEERIFGSDASSYLFGVVNTEWFYTERGRVVIWLSQWLPLMAVWAGFSMQGVLVAHSVGHVLFFYLIFLIGHCVFKNYTSGPILIGIQLLGVVFTYYAWPYGEVQYGLALVLIMMWTIRAVPTNMIFRYGISALLCLFLIGSHPLVWIVALFGAACGLIDQNLRKSTIEYVFIGAVLMFIKLTIFPSYDGELANGATELLLKRNYALSELLDMVQAKPYIHLVVFGSWFLLISSGLFRQLVFSIVAYFLITAVIGLYSPLNAATEQYYMAYSGVALMSFLVNDYSSKRVSKWLPTFLNLFVIVVSLLCLPDILSTGHFHKFRTRRIKALISNCNENGIQHGVVRGANFLKHAPGWSDPDLFHEVLLLSSQQKTVRIQGFEHVLHQLNGDETRGPSAPRLKDLNYSFTESNQAVVRNGIMNQQPEVLNHRLFICDSIVETVRFLNTSFSNTLNEFNWVYIKNPIAELKQGQLIVTFRLVNENELPIYSAQSENVSIEVSVCDSEKTLKKDIEIMADVITHINDVISIPADIALSCVEIRLMHMGNVVHEIECPVNLSQ
jgi:hypothetical protein